MFSHEYRHFGTCKKFTSFHMGTGTTGLVIFSDVFGGKVGKCRGKKAGFWTHGYRHFGTFSDIFRYSHMRVIATHAVYPRFIKTPALREKSAVYPRRISRKCRLFTLVLPALSRSWCRQCTKMRCIQRAQGAFKRWKETTPRATSFSPAIYLHKVQDRGTGTFGLGKI